MIRSKRLQLIITLIITSAFSTTNISGQSEFPLAKDCQGRIYRSQIRNPKCNRWIIEWKNPDGTVWGITTRKTLEAAVTSCQEDVKFHESYARLFGIPLDPSYKNTCAPICDACEEYGTDKRIASLQGRNRNIYDRALQLNLTWWQSLQNARRQFRIFTGRSRNNPYRNVGKVLKDYAEALTNATTHHRQLWFSMTNALDRPSKATFENLGKALQTFERETSNYNKAYIALPVDLKDLVFGRIPKKASDDCIEICEAYWRKRRESGPDEVHWYPRRCKCDEQQ